MPVLNPGSLLAINRKYRPLGDGPAGRVFGRYPYAFSPGSIPPDALALQAMAILDSLPENSGQNPIGRSAQYPYPRSVPARTVHIDTGYMGIAYDETLPATIDIAYYETHPVVDASGLIYWTGPDTAVPAPNLSQAQMLAYQVILANGDTSWSADFYPRSTSQTGGSYAPMSYAPGTSAYTAQQAGATGTGTAAPITTTAPTAPAPTTTAPKPPATPTTLPFVPQVYSSNSAGGANTLGIGSPAAPPDASSADTLGGLSLPGGEGWGGSDGAGGGSGSGVAGIPWGLLVAGALGAALIMRKR